MDREIKFRVWDKELKCMHVCGEEDEHDSIMFWQDGTAEYYNLQNGCGSEVYELMQFTGLYDKNKVPIYEGDIVELDDEGRKLFGPSDSLCEKYQVVGFHDGAFMTNRNKYFQDNYDTYLWILKNYIVVIGNIHDNPDLLGE